MITRAQRQHPAQSGMRCKIALAQTGGAAPVPLPRRLTSAPQIGRRQTGGSGRRTRPGPSRRWPTRPARRSSRGARRACAGCSPARARPGCRPLHKTPRLISSPHGPHDSGAQGGGRRACRKSMMPKKQSACSGSPAPRGSASALSATPSAPPPPASPASAPAPRAAAQARLHRTRWRQHSVLECAARGGARPRPAPRRHPPGCAGRRPGPAPRSACAAWPRRPGRRPPQPPAAARPATPPRPPPARRPPRTAAWPRPRPRATSRRCAARWPPRARPPRRPPCRCWRRRRWRAPLRRAPRGVRQRAAAPGQQARDLPRARYGQPQAAPRQVERKTRAARLRRRAAAGRRSARSSRRPPRRRR